MGGCRPHDVERAQALHAADRAGWLEAMPGLAAECGLSVAHVGWMTRGVEAQNQVEPFVEK